MMHAGKHGPRTGLSVCEVSTAGLPCLSIVTLPVCSIHRTVGEYILSHTFTMSSDRLGFLKFTQVLQTVLDMQLHLFV